jgi:hypothetical protein
LSLSLRAKRLPGFIIGGAMFFMGRTAVADPRLAIGSLKIRSMGIRERAAGLEYMTSADL